MHDARPNQTHLDSRSAAIGAAGATVAAVGLVLGSILAFGGGPGHSGSTGGDQGGVVLPAPAASPSAPVVTPEPSAEPSVPTPASPKPATPKPAAATPKPSTPKPAPATPRPNDGGNDAMPIRVDLRNAPDADVYVDVADETGWLV